MSNYDCKQKDKCQGDCGTWCTGFNKNESEHDVIINDMVNHPNHYNQTMFETIDEMIIVFGKKAVYDFCICNAWKYKARAAYKGMMQEDMNKADWYLEKAEELKNEMEEQ